MVDEMLKFGVRGRVREVVRGRERIFRYVDVFCWV